MNAHQATDLAQMQALPLEAKIRMTQQRIKVWYEAWTRFEIYDKANMIDYLGCYAPEDTLETTGCKRTGCIFCMFGCHLEKEPNRFQRLKETHPRQYQYCIGGGEYVEGILQPSKEGLGLAKVLDYMGVKYD